VAVKTILFLSLIAGLFIPTPSWLSSPLFALLCDLLHFPLFLLLGWILSGLINRRLSLILLLLLVPFSELIQSLVGRSMDTLDALLGWAGAIAWYLFSGKKQLFYIAGLIVTAYTVGLLYFLTPHILALIKPNQIGNFSVQKTMYGWRNIDDSVRPELILKALEEPYGLVLQGQSLTYPWTGVSYDWPIPVLLDPDMTLHFNIYSQKPNLELDIKITSLGGNSSIKSMLIAKTGWQFISVPLNKFSVVLDSKNIKSLSIYYESYNNDDGYLLHNILIGK
jgi:hypothetical protein